MQLAKCLNTMSIVLVKMVVNHLVPIKEVVLSASFSTTITNKKMNLIFFSQVKMYELQINNLSNLVIFETI